MFKLDLWLVPSHDIRNPRCEGPVNQNLLSQEARYDWMGITDRLFLEKVLK